MLDCLCYDGSQMSRLPVPHSVCCVALWVTSLGEPICNTAIPNTNNNKHHGGVK
jgi:hypothetical protein